MILNKIQNLPEKKLYEEKFQDLFSVHGWSVASYAQSH